MDKKIKYLIVGLSILAFVVFKLAFLTLYFGDGNAYFYMAKVVLAGQIPYHNFFLADPPFLVLFLAFLRIFFGNNLLIYQSLPVFFEAGSAFLLFLILEKERNNLAFLAPLIYLFSFSIIALSDSLTGTQLVIFLSLLGILLWKKELPFLSGISWALSCLIKLYAVPPLLGFFIFVLLEKNKNNYVKFILGVILTAFLIMTPFLIVDFNKVFSYIITHQLHRPAGLDKVYVYSYFLYREWFLLILAICGIIISRKKEFLYPFVSSFIFFLLFQDIYYTYFGAFFAYIVIFDVLFLDWIWHKKKELFFCVLAVYFLFLLISLGFYQQTFLNVGRFRNASEIADYVKKLPDKYEIYGEYEVAPIIALLSQRKLFDNYIDTNPQAFGSGALNINKASLDAAKSGVILVSRITDLPDLGIKDFGYKQYFSKEVFENNCKRIKEFESTSNDQDNYIVLYKCEEKNNK